MGSLIITIGPPGCGKSTWADKNLGPHVLRLERDRFREAIFGSKQQYFEHPMARREKSYTLGSAMWAAAKAWPYENYALIECGIHWSSVKNFLMLVEPQDVKLYVFDVPESVIWARNSVRPERDRVPIEALEKFLQDFRDPGAWFKLPEWVSRTRRVVSGPEGPEVLPPAPETYSETRDDPYEDDVPLP